MKLLKNIIKVQTGEEYNFIIHPYYGNIFVLNNAEIDLINKWSEMDDIMTDDENEFIELLKTNRFIVEKKEDEDAMERSVMLECRERYERQKQISSVVFVLTYACNFACPYCYENAANEKSTKIMTKEMVNNIFSLYDNNINNITLYGGEPLLLQNRAIIEYIVAKAPNARYSIITNGYNVIDYLDLIKSIKINNIMITLDGLRETHNKTRVLKNTNEGTFDKIMDGIELLLQNNIKVKIRMNVTNNNLDQCKELRDDMIQKYSLQFEKKLLIFELQPIFQLEERKREEINNELLFLHGKRKDINYFNTMSISVSPVLSSFLNNNKKFIPKYTFCDAEVNRRFFDSEGDIYGCILSLKNKKATIGQYYPTIFFKEKSIATRNIENIEECNDCKFKFLCGGGCANAIMESDGNVLKPNCKIIKEIYEEFPKLFKARITSK